LTQRAGEEPTYQDLVDSLHLALGRKGEPPGFKGVLDQRKVQKTHQIIRKNGKIREALRLKLRPVAAMISLQ